MTPAGALALIARHCDAAGLNHRGVVRASDYDAVMPDDHALAELIPGARSIVVIGNAGRDFWTQYQHYCRDKPGFQENEHDPLDAFTERMIMDLSADLDAAGMAHTPVFYWRRINGKYVSFQKLAECAGLGVTGRFGVLLHPTYGPWTALRAAIATPLELPPTPPLDGFHPCDGCEAPCIDVCPTGAVTRDGWDMMTCSHAKAERDDCSRGCASRWHCVLGPEYRYARDEIEYHAGRASKSIAAFLKQTASRS